MDFIPITSLDPANAPASDKSIRAVVTLSWPYSSSTRQCALLLADPDFRLRNRKGQVRVRLTGASAEAVAKARIGIGDEVVLKLDGAVWEQDSEASRTPGKSVDGELMYRRKLALSVVRRQGNVDINVDAPTSPIRSPERPAAIATPLPKAVARLSSGFDGTSEGLPSYTYTSPAFAKRLRLSGESFLDSAYDPFTTADTNTIDVSETNWKSFGSNLKWRWSEKSPSPKKVHFAGDSTLVGDSSVPELPATSPGLEDTPHKRKMLPPPLPSLQTQSRSQADEQITGPSTPKLQPVSSPTLPLPSPFPTETRQVQFGLVDTAVQSTDSTRPEQASANSGDPIVDAQIEGEDVAMLGQDPRTADGSMQDQASDTEPDDELTQPNLFEQHNVIVDGPTSKQQRTTALDQQTSQAVEPMEAVSQDATQMDRPAPGIPSTPTKASFDQPVDFGLDGASSVPSSSHATPQSEKDKVMAQTYRSLFGFTEPVQAASEPIEKPMLHTPTPTVAPPVWFSDMARTRLQAANIALEDAQKVLSKDVTSVPATTKDQTSFKVDDEQLTAPTSTQSPIVAPEDESLVDLESQGPSIVQQIESPTRPPQAEVVDLTSMSEDEDEDAAPQAHILTAPVAPELPTDRRIPKLEIQDSLADSENENLLAQESQQSRDVPGHRRKRSEASALRNMALEEPQTQTTLEASQPAAGELPNQEPAELEGVASDQIPATSLLSSPTQPIATISSPAVVEVTVEQTQELTAAIATSPLSSPPPGIFELPTSPAAEPLQAVEIAVSDPSRGFPGDHAVPRSTATVIELGSSSPVQTSSPHAIREQPVEQLAPQEVIDVDEVDAQASPSILETSQIRGPSEVDLQSPTASMEGLIDPMLYESQEQTIRSAQHTIQTPLYPSLPLSPSNSQSLRDMQSQEQISTIPETLTSALPPTPQLTQIDSYGQAHDPTLVVDSNPMEGVVVAQTEAKDAEDEAPASQRHEKGLLTQLQYALDENARQSPAQNAEDPPQIGHVMEESLSQSQRTPMPSQSSTYDDETLSQRQKKTPARRSMRLRSSNVPDVLSDWFSPKGASPTPLKDKDAGKRILDEDNVQQMEQVTGYTTDSLENVGLSSLHTAGLSTELSYFTPLSRLEPLLNPSSQQGIGTNTVDILAVVTDATKEPVRAKAGPRDYFTIFKVSDHSLSSVAQVRVEIYRPWMATLPQASVGDVILLRAFAVKSRKRQAYLLSTDASAWCVWRYSDSLSNQVADDGRLSWAKRVGSPGEGVREEVKGPPVELGDEERKHALRLREWWQTVRPEDSSLEASQGLPEGAMSNGHVSEPLMAKL